MDNLSQPFYDTLITNYRVVQAANLAKPRLIPSYDGASAEEI